MKIGNITTFKRKVFIEDFKPRNIRNCIWKCTQNPPMTRFEDNSYQCREGANRSFQDIWNITRSYFPDVTMEEIAYHLARLCYKKYCIANWCFVIKRLVFYPKSIYDGDYEGNIRGNSQVAKVLKQLQEKHKHEWDAE